MKTVRKEIKRPASSGNKPKGHVFQDFMKAISCTCTASEEEKTFKGDSDISDLRKETV